ncbi:MAG: hypothetical protein COX39_03555 [Candidatus Nealsonbacteria bacterium CG23_combo_of_CG06-09_8_20_14_all_40_13]|uniref:Uncharacterized protein n=1 Tax=Candidatus Nealsonbacteria bacterium CG23_combo_of_CG06-09_8_20_14_all_40_13 TaxID=1974724 RepID=A0A2G9YQB8_9BACT|nr:MAG: hypothetical protein COX39_03555 [Candidatus Nealsonbacteria bacterium CG23_combo_of_CG06-09_8_20_14_all_40_13]PIR71288.1 MAG: hypothetical protein COU44_00545 [Candidatus Nealsonbacteria bacterium CG10_big_fil_rev_8_21_14_0_10_40_24]PIU43477.1 MAG: hypothetical protein COS97_00855 [Candidatus Nealsonbacteria bacterium CG07_land_8_20_14_0_80_40_10]
MKTIAFDLDPWIATLPAPFDRLPSGFMASFGNFFPFNFLSSYIVQFCQVRQESKDTLVAHRENGDKIICVTCRPSCCREATKNWLWKNDIPFDDLIMGANDFDSRERFKLSVLGQHDVDTYYDLDKGLVAKFEEQKSCLGRS